jgi:outer membrane protein TolC
MAKHVIDLRVWTLGTLGLALAAPAGLSAQQKADTTPGLQPYVVGQARPPIEPGEQMVPMTLDEAIARALKSNLNIQSAHLNPEIQQYTLLSAEAAFSPTLSTNLGYNNSTTLPTSQLDAGTGISQVTSQRYTFNGSLVKPMPWLGGRLSANFNNNRNESNSAFNTLNPSYSSTFSLNYSQPLLSGLFIDNQRAAVKTQKIQTSITDLQVTSQVASVENQVRRGYWALRAAIEGIAIQQRNLAQAQELLHQDSLQLRVGQMTKTQTLQAAAQVATAEQALLNAQITWRNQDLAFKQLLVSGPQDPLFTEIVDPTSQPNEEQQSVDIPAAIQNALKNRTDIQQQRQQLAISQVNLDVTKTNALPTLTLSAGYSLQGVGGNLYSRSGLGGAPVLVAPGGYSDALQSIQNRDAPTWNLTLQGSYPIGTNPNRANLQRARLQLRQSDLSLKSQELSIITQVTSAGYAVRNAYLQLQAARRARQAAELSFQGEMQRFQVGAATNYEVVQSQNLLTQARLSELQAVINHVNAIAQFQLVQKVGTSGGTGGTSTSSGFGG